MTRRLPEGFVLRTCVILDVVLYLCFALISNAVLAGIVMLVLGAYSWVWETLVNSLRQRAVPLDYQGRVGSVYLVGVFAGRVVGNVIGGVAAHIAGSTAPFWYAFVAGAIAAILLWPTIRAIANASGTSAAEATS